MRSCSRKRRSTPKRVTDKSYSRGDFRLVSLLALVGGGRFGFDGTAGTGDGDARGDGLGDVAFDTVPIGHDEDGDGIRDVDDTCPHVGGAQTDTDGDNVGDLCDPNPAVAGDAIAAFYTMGQGDQPFTLGNVSGDGVWTQQPDALRFSPARSAGRASRIRARSPTACIREQRASR